MTNNQTRSDQGASGEGVDPLRLDLQLCFALYGASNRVTRLYRPLLAPLGLTYPQYLVMLVLWERAPRSVGDLGQALDLDSGTLTPLLKRMETQGLVGRARDPRDERRVIVSLTEKGAALRGPAGAVPGQLVCRLGGDLGDLAALRTALQALNRRLDAADGALP
ncbi:MarR family winged helix-turn-helix transcriptional regulator [Phenylobacterium sp.]|uniref:MarR family winged helix-turn-helix transcriptional regulator n=1 Tax=Phenylobacterium sp. TaxID=1871053 RepID=UPI0027308205|nr:MarR family transcriptional regulator [Phenylobacterium sp.]MDP1875377.1 MarR family transcriptional regulator [Phenylobacterium sp.]MDP3491106.1 MarR family transcriptional regulator [Phenylobacterium sp.]